MVTMPFFCRISSPTIFVKGVVKKKQKMTGGKKSSNLPSQIHNLYVIFNYKDVFYQKNASGPSSPVGPSEENPSNPTVDFHHNTFFSSS